MKASFVFHKMHGAGNDFVLLDLRDQSLDLDASLASFLADRHLGIGCDQILTLHQPKHVGSAVRYEILNADGSSAGQCGNGARCIALYLEMNGEGGSGLFVLESPSGEISITRCADGEYEVDMGEPAFESVLVPISMIPREGKYHLDSPWGYLEFGAASMGNPHALVTVAEIGSAPLSTVGEFIGRHEMFPEGCNVGFAEVVDRDTIHLRVHERGAGETLACGSGACAAVAVLHQDNLVNDKVNVFLPGGHLVIEWSGPGAPVSMKGPADHVFRGTVNHD